VILAELEGAARAQTPFVLTVVAPMFLGRGVAFRLEAAALLALRQKLAARWAAWLGAQDRRPFRPHVTIQNKVAPATARALHGELAAGFRPFTVEGRGLLLWRYLGGPWREVAAVPFAAP
jgi:hypothetical protein